MAGKCLHSHFQGLSSFSTHFQPCSSDSPPTFPRAGAPVLAGLHARVPHMHHPCGHRRYAGSLSLQAWSIKPGQESQSQRITVLNRVMHAECWEGHQGSSESLRGTGFHYDQTLKVYHFFYWSVQKSPFGSTDLIYCFSVLGFMDFCSLFIFSCACFGLICSFSPSSLLRWKLRLPIWDSLS